MGLAPRPLQAVLFDYGDTLVQLRVNEGTLVASERVLLDALPAPSVPLDEFHRTMLEGLRGEYERTAADLREVHYLSLLASVLAGFGVRPAGDDLHRAVRAQIMSWNAVRHLHPAAHEVVDALRARGLRVGYVSNTLDPPEILADVIREEGMAERADAIVLSSRVGYRKPSPRIYREALRQVGAEGERTLFVGDRVLEDVIGPSREGMATCLATWFRRDQGDHAQADAVAADLPEIVGVVDRLRSRG
jgi:putative hydrolase of the HAD superfamily